MTQKLVSHCELLSEFVALFTNRKFYLAIITGSSNCQFYNKMSALRAQYFDIDSSLCNIVK